MSGIYFPPSAPGVRLRRVAAVVLLLLMLAVAAIAGSSLAGLGSP